MRWLRYIVAALVVLGGGLFAGGFVLFTRADVSTVGEVQFANELHVPPLLAPEADADGRKVFDLRLQQGTSELRPGTEAETWGVNGPLLGPTLRATRGDQVVMHVENELPETTTLHWHGMHLPARADGGPHQMIEPGETWQPSWRIDQPAATLWYHPHLMGETADHVYRGLAGMFILDDPAAKALPIPRDYGVDDIPVIIQDKRLNDDGTLDFSQAAISPIGRLGDDILVNGTLAPYLPITRERVRLRLLNGSTARIYNIGFSDDRQFELIGTDGGLLEAPATLDRIQLSPGERAEIVARFEPGEDVVLRSYEPDLPGVDFFNERFVGGDDSLDLLELRAAESLESSPRLPSKLVPLAKRSPAQAVATRRFELSSSSTINDRRMDMSRIDEVVKVGTTEIWEVHNAAGIPHSFHVHDVRFQVLDVDGESVPASLSGAKDTVLVLPGQTMRLLIAFEDYTDPANPYMFHCHILEHEDRGMMGQFTVVD